MLRTETLEAHPLNSRDMRALFLFKNRPHQPDTKPPLYRIQALQQEFTEVLTSEAVTTYKSYQENQGIQPDPFEVSSKDFFYSLDRKITPGVSLDSIARHPLVDEGFDKDVVETFDIMRRGYDNTGIQIEIKYRSYDHTREKEEQEIRAFNEPLAIQKWMEVLQDLKGELKPWLPEKPINSFPDNVVSIGRSNGREQKPLPSMSVVFDVNPRGKMQ